MKENATPFEFYFRGTLACLKGILDYLLEEYNSKYSVGIAENEDLSPLSFAKRANDTKNTKAQSFIEGYNAERKALLSNPKCGKLLARHGTRDIAMHRKALPRNVNLTVHEHGSLSFHAEVKDADGNIISVVDDMPQPVKPLAPEIKYFLSDWTSDDIPTLCEYTLNELRNMVRRVRETYT
jgi:hypothetical protein